ncbi:MAG: hypothetical protein VB934_04160 [Polyangiaceae bacterium]
MLRFVRHIFAMGMLVACESSPQTSVVVEQPEWHRIDVRLSCAPARVGCDATRWIAKVHNRCGSPLTSVSVG